MKELARFIKQGRELLDIEEPVEAHSQFGSWLSSVANWLSIQAPKSGLAEEWKAIGTSVLLIGSRYYNDVASWSIFRNVVQKRIRWLERLGPIPGEASSKHPMQAKPSQAARHGKVHINGPSGRLMNEVLSFLKKLQIPVSKSEPYNGSEDGVPDKNLDFSEIGFSIIVFSDVPAESGGEVRQKEPLSDNALLSTVFQLGYFMGRLGRKRVCALMETGMSIPLKANIVLQIEADSAGAWQIALARGMKAAGIRFDMNLVL